MSMSIRRFELLDGVLSTPKQIDKLVNHPEFGRFFQSLWHNYLMKAGSTTSGTYWSDEFNDHKAFNRALYHLSNAGWIVSHTIPMRNWSTIQLDDSKLLKWVSKEELITIRKDFKFNKYKMSLRESKKVNLTKTPRGTLNVGISRPGIAKSGNCEFKYDTRFISKYYDALVLNTTKNIQKAIVKHQLDLDGADYKSVAIEILDYHLYSKDDTFTLGNSLSDSRGRAISESLSKVFNPIGYKDARALLIGPEGTLDEEGLNQVYLAVAELLGLKAKTLGERTELGYRATLSKDLLNLDLSNEEDRSDLYENIWLERIYDMLDRYDGTNWNVPIELDFTASMIGIEGVLLGDYNMVNEVNIVNAKDLQDVWSKGMNRTTFKFGATPMLYGSGQSCTELWKKRKRKYTAEDVKLFNKELKQGVLGLANDFKDYIIDNVDPKPEMKVNIMGEQFTVYCNKYMNVGDYVKKYPLYDTATNTVLNVNHTHTNKVADLEQFKRYMVTLLVHGIDSQVADSICMDIDWVLPIYDAFIVMPWEAMETRVSATKKLDAIYEAREETLDVYFKSINIVKTVGSEKQWKRLQDKVVPIENFKAEISCVK